MAEEKQSMIDYLKKISPGTPLRTVINDLLNSGLGALIVVDNPELQNMVSGGFRVNCKFSGQRLFELCKMDGAIVVSDDFKRILQANVLLSPDHTIKSLETGTRHQAAERTAKNANTLVIAVSERKNKTTIFFRNSKYFLKSLDELLRDVNSALQILEKERELFENSLAHLNILEITGMVSSRDVSKVIQKSDMIRRISEALKINFMKLGKEGNIMNMRYKNLVKGIEKREENILRDYAVPNLKKSKVILENLSSEGVQDLDAISRLLFEDKESIEPKGYRFLAKVGLSDKEISQIVAGHKGLLEIISEDSTKLENILKGRAEIVKKEIEDIREKILEGKVVF